MLNVRRPVPRQSCIPHIRLSTCRNVSCLCLYAEGMSSEALREVSVCRCFQKAIMLSSELCLATTSIVDAKGQRKTGSQSMHVEVICSRGICMDFGPYPVLSINCLTFLVKCSNTCSAINGVSTTVPGAAAGLLVATSRVHSRHHRLATIVHECGWLYRLDASRSTLAAANEVCCIKL